MALDTEMASNKNQIIINIQDLSFAIHISLCCPFQYTQPLPLSVCMHLCIQNYTWNSSSNLYLQDI